MFLFRRFRWKKKFKPKNVKVEININLKLNFFVSFCIALSSFAYEPLSNFGRSGLLQTPTAYTIPDGSISFGGSYVYPYLRGFISVGFFPGLEVGGTVTVIRNITVNNPGWAGYGSYKDKAFFAKYQILPEMGKFPAVAIGWDDFHGTKLFETRYFVISKYVDFFVPQKVSFGYADGKLLDGFFGGTEVLLHPKASFLLEYANYDKNKLLGLNKLQVSSNWNFGIKIQPLSWVQLVVSYQRGNEYGLNLNFNFPMGGLWVDHKPTFFRLTEKDLKLIKASPIKFYEDALKRLKLSNVRVYKSGTTLVIEYENEKYFFESVALKKVLSVLTVLRIEGVNTVRVVIKNNNIPVTEYEFPAKLVNEYLLGHLSFRELLKSARFTIAPTYEPKAENLIGKFKWKISPRVRTFLNDPSGFFKYMISIDLDLSVNFLNYWRLDANLWFPTFNNISTINEPLMPKPVRSDIADYLGRSKPTVGKLSISYVKNLFPRTFVGISAGYNELMFAGIGGDILYFFGDGSIAVGIGGDYVYKRDPDNTFGLRSWTFHDEYVRFHYFLKKPQMLFSIKAGRFLAGDEGIRFEVSRIVKGFEVGFWYTYSDTSDFTGPNKNYHDKGVFVAVPLRMFFPWDTQAVGVYSLEPWTRDVGQLAGRPFDLYRLLMKKLPFYIEANAEETE